MARMSRLHLQFRAASAIAAAALVAACGGGGDSAPPPPPPSPPPPPASASVLITGKAVDGALQGATACYDTNDNGACDADEPKSASASDSSGNFSISVSPSAAGQHRVIVSVPATAVDADTGQAVGAAFTMSAPPTGITTAHSVFVSPLSNLVVRQMIDQGQTREQAAAFVQQNLGLAVSPLADFTAAGNADNVKAANAARLIVSTQRQQAAAVAGAVGQTDVSGASVTQADVDVAVTKAIASALPAVGAAASDPSLAGKSGGELATAVNALGGAMVTQIGLTVPEVVLTAGAGKLPPEPGATGTPTASASLAALRYTSASDWYMRANISTAADSTPDANGLLRYYDTRMRAESYNVADAGPVVHSWVLSNDPTRAGDLHWNGSAWVGCPLGGRNTQTPRDAKSRSNYDYCDGFEKGTGTRSGVDISGQTLVSVLTQKIRTTPGGASGVNFADWGPSDLSLLGNATFPAGSRLYYQFNTPLETAMAYATRDVDVVGVFSQAVANGGDARTGPQACSNAGTATPAASLEEVIARNPGKPCVNNTQTNADGTSLTPSEAWGLTTLSLGDVANYYATLPAGTGNYYNNTGRMRVAFTGTGNGTVYHQCHVRRVDGSTRNCTPIGTGTYTITQVGDARVMSFNNVPVPAQRVSFTRLVVERGGKVYFGYRNPVGNELAQIRLNLPAANALLAQLGMPVITPTDAPRAQPAAKAANAALLKGVWYFDDVDGAGLLRFDDKGRFLTAVTDAPTATTRPGLELGWFEIDADGKGSRLLEIDTDGQDGFSHAFSGATFSVNATTLSGTINGVTESVQRFPDSGTGLVGVWTTSLTDFKAPTFAFLPSGKMIAIHPYAETVGACATSRGGPPGVESAPYTFNASTGALSVGPRTLDTSGCTGLWDSPTDGPGALFTSTVTIAADGKSAVFTLPEGGTVTVFRVPAQ